MSSDAHFFLVNHVDNPPPNMLSATIHAFATVQVNTTCTGIKHIYQHNGCCAPDAFDKRIYELPSSRICTQMTLPDLPGCDENCYMDALVSRGSALTSPPDWNDYVTVRTVDADTTNPFPFPSHHDAYTYMGGKSGKNTYDTDLFLDTTYSLGPASSGTPITLPLTFSLEEAEGDPDACDTQGYDVWDVASVAISYDAGATFQIVEDPNIPYNGYCAYAYYNGAQNVPYAARGGWSNSQDWAAFSVNATQTSDDVRLRISLASDGASNAKGIAIGTITVGDRLAYSPGDGNLYTGTRSLTWSVDPVSENEWVHMYYSRYYSRNHFVRDLESPFASSEQPRLAGTPRFPTNCSYLDFVNSYDSSITQSQALITEAFRDAYMYHSNNEFRSPLGGTNGCYKTTSNIEPISPSSPEVNASTVDQLDVYGWFNRKMIHPELLYAVELVLDVIPNTMADIEGWKVGDVIVGCHGRELYNTVLEGVSKIMQCITADRKYLNYTLGSVNEDGTITPTSYKLATIEYNSDPRFAFNSWEDVVRFDVRQNDDGENVAYVSFHSWYAISDWTLLGYHAANMFDYFRAQNATKHLVIDQRVSSGGYITDFEWRMSLFLPEIRTKSMADLGFTLWPFSYQTDDDMAWLPGRVIPNWESIGVAPISFESIDILNSRDDCSATEYFATMARKASKRFEDIADVRIVGEPSAGCLHITGPRKSYDLPDQEVLECRVDTYSHNFGHEDIRKSGGVEPDVRFDLGMGDVASFGNFTGFGHLETDPLLAIAVNRGDVPPSPPPPFLEPYNPCADQGYNGYGCEVWLFYYPTFCTDGGPFEPAAAACPTTCDTCDTAGGRRLSGSKHKVKLVFDATNDLSPDPALEQKMLKTLRPSA